MAGASEPSYWNAASAAQTAAPAAHVADQVRNAELQAPVASVHSRHPVRGLLGLIPASAGFHLLLPYSILLVSRFHRRCFLCMLQGYHIISKP